MPPRRKNPSGTLAVAPTPTEGIDDVNAPLLQKVQAALVALQDNDVFHNIVDASPLGIKSGDSDSGVQSPFAKPAFTAAIAMHGAYTCGCNLFWTDFRFSATPGIPLRENAIDQLVRFYFETPAPMRQPIVVSVLDKETNPAEQKGSLAAISPEEVRLAMLFAIARDVAAGKTEEIRTWRRVVLSVNTQFVLHGSSDDRYFAACQLRENLGQDSESMCRTALQRVFEIHRFRESQMARCGVGAGSVNAVAAAYQRVRTAANQAPYSETAVGAAILVMSRMLRYPQVRDLLLRADQENKGSNPFEGISKLEAIARKAKDDEATLTWMVASIWDLVQTQQKSADNEDFSVAGLRGKASTGNRGYADVLIFKRDSIGHLFDALPVELGLDAAWFRTVAKPRLQTHEEHRKTKDDPTWCAGVSRPTVKYLHFLGEFLYGVSYDYCVKALVKQNKQPATLSLQPGITELLADIKNEVDREKKDAETTVMRAATGKDDKGEAQADDDSGDDLVVELRGKKTVESIKVADLADEYQDRVKRCRELLHKVVDSNVVFISKNIADTPDLGVVLATTAAGRLAAGDGSTFTAVLYDSKSHGESQHKAQYRLPALQVDDLKQALEAARGRHRSSNDNGELGEHDLYFLFDGGRDVGTQLMGFFRGKACTTRAVHLVADPEALLKRVERIKGLATQSGVETLRVVSANGWPEVLRNPRSYKYYKGSTALNIITNIPLPAREQQWQMSWAEKKTTLRGPRVHLGWRPAPGQLRFGRARRGDHHPTHGHHRGAGVFPQH